MKITLTDVGKRFNRDWIFRHLSYEFTNGNSYAITGPNGSGKSTLLQVIAGAVAESEGKIEYKMTDDRLTMIDSGSNIHHRPSDIVHPNLSIAAPYLEVIEEMTLVEFLRFHQVFKPFITGMDIPKIMTAVSLEKSAHKQIRYFSSGMKQRVKLAQAFFSDTSVLLLDEPCTNLDEEGVALYHQLINDYSSNRIVIISSNDKQEYDFCNETLNILDYKK